MFVEVAFHVGDRAFKLAPVGRNRLDESRNAAGRSQRRRAQFTFGDFLLPASDRCIQQSENLAGRQREIWALSECYIACHTLSDSLDVGPGKVMLARLIS